MNDKVVNKKLMPSGLSELGVSKRDKIDFYWYRMTDNELDCAINAYNEMYRVKEEKSVVDDVDFRRWKKNANKNNNDYKKLCKLLGINEYTTRSEAMHILEWKKKVETVLEQIRNEGKPKKEELRQIQNAYIEIEKENGYYDDLNEKDRKSEFFEFMKTVPDEIIYVWEEGTVLFEANSFRLYQELCFFKKYRVLNAVNKKVIKSILITSLEEKDQSYLDDIIMLFKRLQRNGKQDNYQYNESTFDKIWNKWACFYDYDVWTEYIDLTSNLLHATEEEWDVLGDYHRFLCCGENELFELSGKEVEYVELINFTIGVITMIEIEENV